MGATQLIQTSRKNYISSVFISSGKEYSLANQTMLQLSVQVYFKDWKNAYVYQFKEMVSNI